MRTHDFECSCLLLLPELELPRVTSARSADRQTTQEPLASSPLSTLPIGSIDYHRLLDYELVHEDRMIEHQPSSALAIILAAAAAIVCPFITMAAAVAGVGAGESNSKMKNEDAKNERSTPWVPFFYVPPMKTNCQDAISAEPPFSDLLKSLDKYSMDTSSFLASLTRQHEVARRSEWIIYGKQGDTLENSLLAAAYREKIGRIAECLESDYAVLEDLMQPFEVVIGLPSSEGEIVENSSNEDDNRDQNHNDVCINYNEAEETRHTTMPGRRKGNDDDGSSYDSAAQIVTHVVRDWSAEGQTIRQSLYSWCVDMVDKYHFKDERQFGLPILVPGSGLGRLAYELSTAGYVVEANDVSISMVAVAEKLLNGHIAVKSRELHPFSFDFLVNEVDSDSRYDSVAFPDVEVSPGERLSYTLGDFVTTYGSTQKREKYGAVVSCFFIDTATNIYEYLAIISSVLCSGGLWVNVGPVQWHQNALVQPSGLELKALIQGFGFEILTWSIDTEGVNYRHDEDHRSRYTKAEAYLPIRFVARKQSNKGNYHQDAARAIRDLREMTAVDHKVSTAFASSVAREGTQGGDSNTFVKEHKKGKDKANGEGGFVFVDRNDDDRTNVMIEELS